MYKLKFELNIITYEVVSIIGGIMEPVSGSEVNFGNVEQFLQEVNKLKKAEKSEKSVYKNLDGEERKFLINFFEKMSMSPSTKIDTRTEEKLRSCLKTMSQKTKNSPAIVSVMKGGLSRLGFKEPFKPKPETVEKAAKLVEDRIKTISDFKAAANAVLALETTGKRFYGERVSNGSNPEAIEKAEKLNDLVEKMVNIGEEKEVLKVFKGKARVISTLLGSIDRDAARDSYSALRDLSDKIE